MRVRLRILGVPGLAAAEREVELPGRDACALESLVPSELRGALAEPRALLVLVNGRVARGDWRTVEVRDGDAAWIVVPASGG